MQPLFSGGLQAKPFFFAATKIRIERGPRRCYDHCRRNRSSSRQRRIESDADLVAATATAGGPFSFAATKIRIRRGRALPLRPLQAILFSVASIRKSEPEIKNHCTVEGVSRQKAASIRKSVYEIKNRCSLWAVSGENLASIRKSGPEIKNRCTLEGVSGENLASILKSGLEFKNRCTQEGING